jgi:hypothetical protein
MFLGPNLGHMMQSTTLNVESQGTTPPSTALAGLSDLAGGLTARLQTALQEPLQHAARDLANTATSAANATANAMEVLKAAPMLAISQNTATPSAESPIKLNEIAESRPQPSAPDYSPKKVRRSRRAASIEASAPRIQA